jgi:mannan endo-1,4-beta-mannosidase
VNYRAWVEEMAGYVKRLDGQHLVTIGEEGFFGEERAEAVHNPQVGPLFFGRLSQVLDRVLG